MFKIFVIGIQIFSLIFLGWLQPERVSISSDTPEAMMPGEETVVTITINKSNIKGFAKFQMNLGDGLVAEPVETAGATFTFHDGVAKFIWLSLPGEDRFDLKYRLGTKDDFEGWTEISSTFSFIHENKRYNSDAPKSMIKVGDFDTDSDVGKAETGTSTTSSPIASRRLIAENANQWRVVVEIDKSELQGFAKVEENIPAGYTAIDLKSSSAVFTSDGTTVKYVWYDIPKRDKITVIYKLLPVIAMDGDEPEINGEFAYLEGDETRTIPIHADGFAPEIIDPEPKDTTGADVLDIIALDDAEEEEIPKESATTEDDDPDEVAVLDTPDPQPEIEEEKKPQDVESDLPKPEPTTTEKAYTDANIVDVPAPETGIFYRVQIAAGKNNLNRETFSKLYRFDEGFKLESLAGLFKYTTGHHTVYKQARNDRERITHKYQKFQGPFVTAYNDGERITVQEALLISQQNWVP